MKRCYRLALWVSIGVVLAVHSNQSFADFHYQVDYFEVIGNQPGNARDDFDDGTVAPWYIEEQTAFETGGHLHLTTPGDYFGPYTYNGVSWVSERSSVRTDDAPGVGFDVAGGAGDFTATSRWTSAVPGRNEFYGMELWWNTGGSNGKNGLNLNMYNVEDAVVDALGLPSNLGIWWLTNNDLPAIQAIAIADSDITGDVLFRLDFDDTADLISAAFSLDGGSTFQSPFAPIPFDLAVYDMEWYLEAEEWAVVPEPASLSLSLVAFGSVAFLRKRLKSPHEVTQS